MLMPIIFFLQNNSQLYLYFSSGNINFSISLSYKVEITPEVVNIPLPHNEKKVFSYDWNDWFLIKAFEMHHYFYRVWNSFIIFTYNDVKGLLKIFEQTAAVITSNIASSVRYKPKFRHFIMYPTCSYKHQKNNK